MDKNSIRWARPKNGTRPPFVNLVPLQEILLAPEFRILLNTSLGDIEKFGRARLREAVGKVREGSIFVKPGYDGIFGKVSIWPQDEEPKLDKPRQQSIF